MAVIFLCGGIASGKSQVAELFSTLGAERIDLDALSHTVLADDPACKQEVIDAFGYGICTGMYDEDAPQLRAIETAEIDRSALASKVFSDDAARAKLEAIELPYIRARLADRLAALSCAATSPEVVVVEIPLLDRVEDLLDLADYVLYVATPFDKRKQFALKRGMEETDFEARAASQPDDAYMRRHATDIVENTSTLDDLLRKAHIWWRGHGFGEGRGHGSCK